MRRSEKSSPAANGISLTSTRFSRLSLVEPFKARVTFAESHADLAPVKSYPAVNVYNPYCIETFVYHLSLKSNKIMSSSSIPKQTKAWIVANPPQAEIKPDTFELVTRDIPELKDGEVLVKVSHLSNDPAQRGWIQKDADEHRLYVPPIRAGEVMRSGGLGKVVASKSSKFSEGDEVQAQVCWNEYAVLNESAIAGKAV
jgi:hypothetical protein